MRKFLVLFFALVTTMAFSQSIHTIKKSKSGDFFTESVSLNNPWVGAKLTTALNDPDNNLSNNFIFSAKILKEVSSGENYSIPIVSSISLGSNDLLSAESGFNIGVFPYYILERTEKFTLVAHGGVNYKILPQEAELDLSPQQVKILAGLEVAISEVGQLPATLSVTPIYYMNNLEVDDFFGVEGTAVVPIGEGVGVLLEYQHPFKDEIDGIFRVGVIVNSIVQ